MNKFDEIASYDVQNAKRTFDEFYEFPSSQHGKYMCFGSTVVLKDSTVADVMLSVHDYSVSFFNIWDNTTPHVCLNYNDPDGAVQLFNSGMYDNNPAECLEMFKDLEDVTDEALVKFNLTRENLILLKRLHDELLEILKKDETIQKVVL